MFAKFRLFLIASLFFAPCINCQLPTAPMPQSGTIIGVVTDTENAIIPDAEVTIQTSSGAAIKTAKSADDGTFDLSEIPTAAPVKVVVKANGFGEWHSEEITLTPGERFELSAIAMTVATVETSVSAVFADQLAIEQVKDQEKQRILGVIPNFYVSYDRRVVPLSTKLKFQLALKAAVDPVTLAGAVFIAGIDQAADTPSYRQGAAGYGQRVGAVTASATTNILFGGAILPSLFHQDPRYFYMGTGTKKARAMHALSAPFVAKGDNGNPQFNISSIGGDLISSSLSNIYYPNRDRGAGLVFSNALILTGARVANTLAQEFIFSRFTSKHQ